MVAGAVLVLAVLSGCGGSAGKGRIDVSALERELEVVTRLEKLTGGTEFDMQATCTPSGSDELHFSCRVDASIHGTAVNSWTVLVDCRPPDEGSGHRCASDTGYALQ
jgi:hypothetical protein